MERERNAGGGGCGEIVAMAAATFISPAAALPGAMFATWLAFGSGAGSFSDSLLESLAALLTGPFTTAGLYAYSIAFLPCLFAGAAMTACSSVWPACRRYPVWAAVGAVLGALIGLLMGAFATTLLVSPGAGAGTACALLYRLIVGFAMPSVEQANPRPAPPG
jgi:hypothetical protein